MRKINLKLRLKLGDSWRKLRYHAFWRDTLAVWGLAAALVGNAVFWIVTAFKIRQVGEIIPLHYNVYFGVDQIGARADFLKIPELGLLVLILNLFLALNVYKHERLGAYFLILTAALMQIFLLIAGVLIINL